MRREEWVSVQGPVKEQQPDVMSHGGGLDGWQGNGCGGGGGGGAGRAPTPPGGGDGVAGRSSTGVRRPRSTRRWMCQTADGAGPAAEGEECTKWMTCWRTGPKGGPVGPWGARWPGPVDQLERERCKKDHPPSPLPWGPGFTFTGLSGRSRALGGERPMGSAAYGRRGAKGRPDGERPIGAARCRQQSTAGVIPPPPPTQGGPTQHSSQ